MERYAEGQPLSLATRLRIAGGRIVETSDDELTYAYYSANIAGSDEEDYKRGDYAKRYQDTATSLYERRHVTTVIRMVWRALGLNPLGIFARVIAGLSWRVLARRTASLRTQTA